MPKPKDRAPEIRRALDSLKCQHPESVISTDFQTGDYFCGDCGDVVNAWANQTALQRGRYVRDYGHIPPAQEAGSA